MPSTYSPSLRLELIGSGEQSGTWGLATNSNLGTLVEQAITGVQTITLVDAVPDYSLTNFSGVSNEARNAVLTIQGLLTSAHIVTIPSANKLYTIYNATTATAGGGFPITIKTAVVGGAVFSVPNGTKKLIYCDGTNVYSVNPNITGNTASSIVPVGTSSQRDTIPLVGYFRFNNDLNSFEGVKQFAGPTISSITKTAGTSTATLSTATPHGLVSTNIVVVSGATEAKYNGEFPITKTGNNTFTYTMASEPSANASIVGTYVSLLWGSVGGGATGASGNDVFYENSQIVSANYTITSGKSAMSTGPITTTGCTVTIPSGSRWVIL